MKYYVYDKLDKEFAVIEVDDEGFYGAEFKDSAFESFLNSKISEGIKVFDEKHEEDAFIAVTKTVSKDDKNAGYAILEFLRYNGYEVRKDADGLKIEIEAILSGFPEDDSKKDILSTLPDLNYLETTLLLRELKNQK